MKRGLKLFVVTLQEKGNPNCEREVYAHAETMDKAWRRATRANPHGLWRPIAVGVRRVGPLA